MFIGASPGRPWNPLAVCLALSRVRTPLPAPHVASACSGPAPAGAPARGSAGCGLDRALGSSRALAPAARASSPLGDYARREPRQEGALALAPGGDVWRTGLSGAYALLLAIGLGVPTISRLDRSRDPMHRRGCGRIARDLGRPRPHPGAAPHPRERRAATGVENSADGMLLVDGDGVIRSISTPRRMNRSGAATWRVSCWTSPTASATAAKRRA